MPSWHHPHDPEPLRLSLSPHQVFPAVHRRQIGISLAILLASSGCSSTSVYEIVAEEIVNPANARLRYATSWDRARPLEISSPAEEREAFYKDVAACIDALESRRIEFMKQLSPSKSLAALQMNECLSDKGWQLKVVEEIILG